MINASVKRRNGTVVPFDGSKIKIAVGKALNATHCEHNEAVLDDPADTPMAYSKCCLSSNSLSKIPEV